VNFPLALGLLLAPPVPNYPAFEKPTESEQRAALGDLTAEPAAIRAFLTPDADFFPIPTPGPNDWLMFHREPRQTFDEYVASRPNRPDEARRIIYLLPLGDFPEETAPSMEEVRAYAAAFFQLEVRVLPAYLPHALEFEPREHPRTRQRQVRTQPILSWLMSRLPEDAYCLLGVTMDDLYPDPAWNYVFGMASLRDRVGVYSFARYDPAFWGEERGPRYQEQILQRSVKVLAHETAHMFGLPHCVFFSCVVNGSNHLVETDARPQHLCPICLRKLQHTIRFDPARRYAELGRFYRRHAWFEEFDFTQRQLSRVPATAGR
jgi:archaemetzincin